MKQSAILFLSSGLLAVTAIASFVWRRRMLKRWSSIEAVVVEVRRSHGDGGVMSAPVFKFVPHGKDEEVIVQSQFWASGFAYHVGKKVPVLFDSINPSKAVIARGWQVHFWTVCVAALALLVCFGGFIALATLR